MPLPPPNPPRPLTSNPIGGRPLSAPSLPANRRKRKRRFGLPSPHTVHPNVTPLIDIMMCLVIFFMLVAKIGISTGAQAMELPASIRGTDIKNYGNTLTLNVYPGPDNMPRVMVLLHNQETELAISDAAGNHPLAEALAYFRYGPDRRKGTGDDNSSFAVILRAEADIPYRYIEPVLLATAQAGVKTVNFNTRKLVVPAGEEAP